MASQQSDGNFDINRFRAPFESNTEWGMRRRFIDAHHDKLDEDRLICLANCYVNVDMYGCTYPHETMVELRELTKELEN